MQLNKRPTWDELFMRQVYDFAEKSKDPRTHIGAVIIYWDTKDPISFSYNGISRGLEDKEERLVSPEKHFWMAHAEANGVFNCARTGRSCFGATIFTNGIPCSSCCDAIIQSGIKEVVVHEEWLKKEYQIDQIKYKERYYRNNRKLREAGIVIRFFKGKLGVQGFLDGFIFEV